MREIRSVVVGLAMLCTAPLAMGDTLAQWTFETSVPATAGPHAAEVGSGSALGFHVGATVYSNPSGNGSAESFSSTLWALGDYYQYSTSSTGFEDISVAFDHVSSGTGPRDFEIYYSTDGTAYTTTGSTYIVLDNASSATPVARTAWNGTTPQPVYSYLFDFSAISALDNQASIYFRMVMDSTADAAPPGTVAVGGTSRMDNVAIFGDQIPVVAVPLPPAVYGGMALMGLIAYGRRKMFRVAE